MNLMVATAATVCFTMLNAHPSLMSIICATVSAASFDLCPVLHAHSSLDSIICASFTAASFDSMLLAKSSPVSKTCTTIFAATSAYDLSASNRCYIQ
jgi:uncharacterized membrane protein YjjB (DUF3815 family)